MINLTPLRADVIVGFIIILLVIFMIYNHRKLQSRTSADSDGINIKDVIHKVELELKESAEEREKLGLPKLFDVQSFDLELNFVVKKRYTQEGKIEYSFIAISGENEVASEQTQKITLHMNTVMEGEKGEKPAGDRPPPIGPDVIKTSTPPK